MISKQEVEHIAKLARLELTEEEILKMQKDMSAILDYFDLLKKAPKLSKESTKNVEYKAEREDIAISSQDIIDELISQAPDEKDGYIKVKNIF